MSPLANLKTLCQIVFGIVLCCATAPALAKEPALAQQRAGLMWNRTGLPAVFPLLVKSSPGSNYYVTLVDPKTGAAALAAFVNGGAFFKVLVPPGTYTVRFAAGTHWLGDALLFGSGQGTYAFELDAPLTFGARDFSTKAGHLVDIRNVSKDQITGIKVSNQTICQTVRLETFPRAQLPFEDDGFLALGIPKEGQVMGFPRRYSEERLLDSGAEPIFPTRYAPYVSAPEFGVSASPC